MKKLIEIDDSLYERLEKIQKDYHINSLTPVISLILTIGTNWFKKLEAIIPQVYTPQWDFWSPYISDGSKDISIDDKWNIITNLSGYKNEPEE